MGWHCYKDGTSKWWKRSCFTILRFRNRTAGYNYQLSINLHRNSHSVLAAVIGMFKGSSKGFKLAKMKAESLYRAMKSSIRLYKGKKHGTRNRKVKGKVKAKGSGRKVSKAKG